MTRRTTLLSIAGALVVAIVVLGGVLLTGDADDPDVPPGLRTDGGKTVTVYNRVTSGPTHVREDEPLRLFFAPELCRRQSCVLPIPEFETGDRIGGVVCQTRGERITNGNDGARADDRNPRLVESTLWYGVRTTDDRLAYFSEVWVEPRSRGGLGLPDCSALSANGTPYAFAAERS